MKRSPSDGHFLVQIQTRILNDELRQTFRRWYPGMHRDAEEMREAV
jgi:hypothetical protein